MRILVLNVGSSSLKVQLIDTDEAAMAESLDRRLARVHVEQIGGDAIVVSQVGDAPAVQSRARLRDHTEAMQYVIDSLIGGVFRDPLSTVSPIEAVGNR